VPYARRRSTERFQITAARLDYGTMRSAEAIAVEAPSLPVNERAALVLRLAESLDEERDADAEEAWAAEVAARIEAVRAGTAETITTAEALAQARARLSARRG
jgi:putative addiction module component (TIGR02574 family)